MSGGAPSAPPFQIIVVLYNDAKWIAACLDAISRAEGPAAETWVVDNASADGGAEVVERGYPWAKLERSGKNLGFAGGNNLAAAHGPRTEFILLLNPDTEIHPAALGHLARAFAERPKLGVAGFKIYYPGGERLQHVGGELRSNALPYHVGDGEIDRGQYTGVRPCAYAQGAAFAVRRAVWDALGGLDERYSPAYFEEADFCEGARRAGWEVAVVCDATVIHHQDPTKQVASESFLRMLFRGRGRFLVKRYGLLDWMFRYAPSELKWILSKNSKGYRRIALKELWAAAREKRPRA